MTTSDKYQEISIQQGKTEIFELPPYPRQAPSFFRWKVEYGGGSLEIDEEENLVMISADKLGSHSISFVPATTEGKILMSGQYTGCGADHRVLVTIYRNSSSSPDPQL